MSIELTNRFQMKGKVILDPEVYHTEGLMSIMVHQDITNMTLSVLASINEHTINIARGSIIYAEGILNFDSTENLLILDSTRCQILQMPTNPVQSKLGRVRSLRESMSENQSTKEVINYQNQNVQQNAQTVQQPVQPVQQPVQPVQQPVQPVQPVQQPVQPVQQTAQQPAQDFRLLKVNAEGNNTEQPVQQNAQPVQQQYPTPPQPQLAQQQNYVDPNQQPTQQVSQNMNQTAQQQNVVHQKTVQEQPDLNSASNNASQNEASSETPKEGEPKTYTVDDFNC